VASVFKPEGAKKYVIVYADEHGRRRKKTAYTDRRESERLASKLEETARKVRDGLMSRSEANIVSEQKQSLDEHLVKYHQFLLDADKTPKFADLAQNRLRKLFRIAKASRFQEITLEGVQSALSQLRTEGRGLKTLNHYGDTAKMFLDWCRRTDRIARNPLVELGRYNAKTDVRHERRSISLDEFAGLLDAARSGRRFGRMTGPVRELCYRFTFMTGLRFNEVKAVRPEWFDWRILTVTIPAKFSKNRKRKVLPIDATLASDLKNHIGTLDPLDSPVFPMPKRGYSMIKVDLEKAKIPYVLDGKTFDFHAVRGMTATVHDEIGTPSGVRRDLMRHATDAMTALYTRPREDQGRLAVDRLASALGTAGRATKSATNTHRQNGRNDVSVDADMVSGDDTDEHYAGAIPAASTFQNMRQQVTVRGITRLNPLMDTELRRVATRFGRIKFSDSATASEKDTQSRLASWKSPCSDHLRRMASASSNWAWSTLTIRRHNRGPLFFGASFAISEETGPKTPLPVLG
jgi:integrase